MGLLDGKRILITGVTGSLGKVLLRRLLSGKAGQPAKIIGLSRDEAKQHALRVQYLHSANATEDVAYENFSRLLELRIGDVRDYPTIASALNQVDIVFNAAALKQVPSCEYFPFEAVRTNIGGAENIARAIRELRLDVETVVGISTDKAVKPVNVMGMTKALHERVLMSANLYAPQTRFVLVRYGNVLASRGSVVPLFHEQIKMGGPVTITSPEMTRFLISLEEAVDIILGAVADALPGETFIPIAPTAKITDLAYALIGSRNIPVKITGIRPGEKLHEVLISEEEMLRSEKRGNFYAIAPILPELRQKEFSGPPLAREYSSEHDVMTPAEVLALLTERQLLIEDGMRYEGEILR